MSYGINYLNRSKMNKYIDENGLANVESLTKAWKEVFASNYSDKPRLCSLLISTHLTFEVQGELLKVVFDVANDAQKEWLEVKMIPEMTELFKSITGINELSIQPVISESGEKDSRKYCTPLTGAVTLEDITCAKNLVKDQELDIN